MPLGFAGWFLALAEQIGDYAALSIATLIESLHSMNLSPTIRAVALAALGAAPCAGRSRPRRRTRLPTDCSVF